MRYNHDRTLSEYEEDIDKLKSRGFNPIAVSQMFFEDVYVFETNEEAERAYRIFERDEKENWIGDIVGWWNGREEFIREVDKYEKEGDITVLIYWINR